VLWKHGTGLFFRFYTWPSSVNWFPDVASTDLQVVDHQTVFLARLFLSDSQSQRTGIIRTNQGYPWSLSLRVFALL
jgi:hypothetical protein